MDADFLCQDLEAKLFKWFEGRLDATKIKRRSEMSRDEMIEGLIYHELSWLHHNFDKHSLQEVTDFFAKGGFANWSDEQISKKFADVYGKE